MTRADYGHLSDEELVSKLKEGDAAALERIYDRYWKKLYQAAFGLFRDEQLCEDLVQEIFIRLWTKRGSLDIVSLRSYLYASVRNRTLNLIRSNRVQVDLSAVADELDLESSPEQRLYQDDIRQTIRNGVLELPDRCREIFLLSREELLTAPDIARRLGIAPKTVENQLTIALKRLRASLGQFLSLILL